MVSTNSYFPHGILPSSGEVIYGVEKYLSAPTRVSGDEHMRLQMRECAAYFRAELKKIAREEIKTYKDAKYLVDRFECHPLGHTAGLLPPALLEFFTTLLGPNRKRKWKEASADEESMDDTDANSMDTSADCIMAEDIGVCVEDSSTEEEQQNSENEDVSDESKDDDTEEDEALPHVDPALSTMATICLKAANASYVSPLAWRVLVYNHSRGKVDCTRLMNRILLSGSYSFLRKVRAEFAKRRNVACHATAEFAGGSTGVLSSDNIQKQGTPSTASNAAVKMVIVTSTVFRMISNTDIQSEKSPLEPA